MKISTRHHRYITSVYPTRGRAYHNEDGVEEGGGGHEEDEDGEEQRAEEQLVDVEGS